MLCYAIAGGVIDSIMSFQAKPSDKMVDGINKFSNIDANAISNLTEQAVDLLIQERLLTD